MALVGYSDSESSDDEQKRSVSKPAAAKTTSSKPAFKKVTDRSNPHKIVVNLPTEHQKDEASAEEPPAKKPRLGGGGLSGFNALLPAPKRAGPAALGNNKRGGLGSGVNLKTGSAPGFSREPAPAAQEPRAKGDELETAGEASKEVDDVKEGTVSAAGPPAVTEEPKKFGNPMMFRPLSVARKPQKKKKPATSSLVSVTSTSTSTMTQLQPSASLADAPQPKPAPKVSLFSIGNSEDTSSSYKPSQATTDYSPLLYNTEPAPSVNATINDDYTTSLSDAYTPHETPSTSATDPKSLQDIANDLNLSASARRQLLGRGKDGAPSNVKITHFSTDAEYASNEALRQAGEEQVHNPVRAIAAGKHSLRQLVNAVSNQKDALEESFAAGRRTRKEAGTRYGW